MKKLLYPIVGFILFCLSFTQNNKKIEEQDSRGLILRPFQMLGLLYSCSTDDPYDLGDNTKTNEKKYPEGNPDDSDADGGSSEDNSGTGDYGDGGHTYHFSSTHASHSSHYSSSHISHQSHSSHSSHYSAR